MSMSGLPDLPAGVQLKDIPGYEGIYAVTSDGRVWSYSRDVSRKNGTVAYKKGRFLKPRITKEFLAVSLRCGDLKYYTTLNHLVGLAYIPNPLNNKSVKHIDRNSHNNCVGNLTWVDEVTLGQDSPAKKINQYTLDNVYINTYKSAMVASKKLNIHRSAIGHCLTGKHKTCGGFIWKYAD